VWTRPDQEQLWVIPDVYQDSYKCYGFRVHHTNNSDNQAAIQDAKLYIEPQTDKYIELTTELGTAYASDTYSTGYNAEKAFKISGEGENVYWCTSRDPVLPVFLWFQFNNPKTVFKVKFLVDRYHLPTAKVYEVFASNLIDNCENTSGQTILCSGTADEFVKGKRCANIHSYHCYGLKVSDHSTHPKKYIAVRKLQFLFKEKIALSFSGATYSATSVYNPYIRDYGPHSAFSGPDFAWLSAEGEAFPQLVHFCLPSATTISSFSFRSDDDFDKSPTKFDFVGSTSYYYETWTVIIKVANATWTTYDQEQSWDIPVGKGGPFLCFGFKVHNTVGNNNTAIKDVQLWRVGYTELAKTTIRNIRKIVELTVEEEFLESQLTDQRSKINSVRLNNSQLESEVSSLKKQIAYVKTAASRTCEIGEIEWDSSSNHLHCKKKNVYVRYGYGYKRYEHRVCTQTVPFKLNFANPPTVELATKRIWITTWENQEWGYNSSASLVSRKDFLTTLTHVSTGLVPSFKFFYQSTWIACGTVAV